MLTADSCRVGGRTQLWFDTLLELQNLQHRCLKNEGICKETLPHRANEFLACVRVRLRRGHARTVVLSDTTKLASSIGQFSHKTFERGG